MEYLEDMIPQSKMTFKSAHEIVILPLVACSKRISHLSRVVGARGARTLSCP